MEINFDFAELDNELDFSLNTTNPGSDFLYYTRTQTDNLLSGKVNVSQGTANSGKILAINAAGNVVPTDDFITVTSVTKWNVMRQNQTETPNLTLPAPETGKPQEILYIFTAMTANATFTAPTGYILFDQDKPMSSATTGITYTDLTVGSMYECDFMVVGTGKIALLILEHTEV